MASIKRMKLLMAVGAAALVFGVGAHQSQAATYVGLSQFGTDTTVTATSTGVTVSNPFPDGTTTAKCFILITDKGDHTPAYTPYGDCSGDQITDVKTSYVSDSSAVTLVSAQNGAALSINGTGTYTFAYDAGAIYPASGSFTATNLNVAVTNNAGEKVVLLVNNDTGTTARNGCFNYVDAGGEATPQCFAVDPTNMAGGKSGAFYEAQTQATSGMFAEGAAASGTGSSGNIPVEGVFFLAGSTTGGTATSTPTGSVSTPTSTPVGSVSTPTATATQPVLAASYVRVHRSHGMTHLMWISSNKVRGYNVFDHHTRINKKLVTSKTNIYHFNTKHVFKHLRLVAKH